MYVIYYHVNLNIEAYPRVPGLFNALTDLRSDRFDNLTELYYTTVISVKILQRYFNLLIRRKQS